jgi:Protein of unknown function (DUF3987)/Primase C terminal 2 (PriCT-2)
MTAADTTEIDNPQIAGAAMTLIVDRNEIARFVDALFFHAERDTFVSMRAFWDRKAGVALFDEWRSVRVTGNPDDIVDAAEDLAKLAAFDDEAVCFAPPICTFKTRDKADVDNLANGLVISAELDGNPADGRKRLEEVLGPPTLAMQSGGLWIDAATGEAIPKLHLHWRLAKPTRDPVEHDFLYEANKLATKLAGGDPSGIPLVHPLRWPGSWHRKAEPRLAGIIACNPEIEIPYQEALGKLRAATKAQPRPNGRDHSTAFTGIAQAEWLDICAALAVIPNDDTDIPKGASWKKWDDMGLRIHAATGGSAAGYDLFSNWSARSTEHDPANTRNIWLGFKPTRTGAGALFNLAEQHYPGFMRTRPSEYRLAAQREVGLAAFEAQPQPPLGSGTSDHTGPDPITPKPEPPRGNGHDPEAATGTADPKVGGGSGGGGGFGTNPPLLSAETPGDDDDDDDGNFRDPAGLLEPSPTRSFPIDFLPGALGEFARQQALGLQVPLDFVGVPLLVAAAATIGKDFRMAPKAYDNWTERACLWGGCIGHVGDGKSPAFNAALSPVWPLQERWREEYAEELKAYKAAVQRAKAIAKQWEKDAAAALKKGQSPPPVPPDAEPPEPPTLRQIVTNDATQEQVASILMNNPRGALLYRDELSGWFSTFNQYRPGADEEFYLQCHSGGPWWQQRVKGDITIPDICLSIFGGFQPGVINAALARGGYTDKPDNGLTARFGLLVWPDAIASIKWIDSPPDRDLREHINRVFAYLAELDPERFVGPRKGASHFPPLRFTPPAQKVFQKWFVQHHEAQQLLDPEDQIKGHFSKYDGLFARLALVHHLLRYAQGENIEPACVDELTAVAVHDFIEAYLRPHAMKIYQHLARDPGYQGARKIARWLLENPQITSFTARDISRKDWTGLTGKNENTGKDYLRAALYHLDNIAGWVRVEEIPAGPRGGRPTTLYIVNPKIHDGGSNTV